MESRAAQAGRGIAAGLLLMLSLMSPGIAGAEVSSDQPAAIVLLPKLVVDSSIGVDTLVRLSNTSTKNPLTLHCFLVDASPLCPNDDTRTCLSDSKAPKCSVPCVDRWNETDFRLILTANQPVGWLISQGMRDCRSNPSADPDRPCFRLDGVTHVGQGNQSNAGSNIVPAPHDQFVGYLQCIAVDDTDAPVVRNDLKGEATIVRDEQHKVCTGGNLGTSCMSDPDCAVASGACVAHAAAFAPISQPDTTYTSSTTLIPITIADASTTTSLSDAALAVTFDKTMTAATVPAGGWNTWGSPPATESSTPRVLFNRLASQVTLTLSPNGAFAVGAFGLELEQDKFTTDTITADFYNGSQLVNTVTRSVTTPSGARLFAAATDEQFTRVVITLPAADGIGLAQVRYKLVPTAAAASKKQCIGNPDRGCTTDADCSGTCIDAGGKQCTTGNVGVACASAADCTAEFGKCFMATCVGNSALSCTSDANCVIAGTCAVPATKLCSAGQLGASCTQDSSCDVAGVCTTTSSLCTAGAIGKACAQSSDCNLVGKCGAPAHSVDVDGYNGVGLQALAGKNNQDSTLCLGGCIPGQGQCRVTRSQSCFSDQDCPGSETCVGKCVANPHCPKGPEYDGCANILLLDHFFDGATDPVSGLSVVTDLTLVPCTQDYLRQGPPQITVQFLVFNEFEQRFSTSTPVKCFKEFRLSSINPPADNIKSIFSAAVNGTLTGQTRIRGVAIDDPAHGDTLIGVAREFRCGPGSTLANCHVVGSAGFNLHSQGRRPEPDIIYLPGS